MRRLPPHALTPTAKAYHANSAVESISMQLTLCGIILGRPSAYKQKRAEELYRRINNTLTKDRRNA